MTDDWGMKVVQVGMVFMGFIALWIVGGTLLK